MYHLSVEKENVGGDHAHKDAVQDNVHVKVRPETMLATFFVELTPGTKVRSGTNMLLLLLNILYRIIEFCNRNNRNFQQCNIGVFPEFFLQIYMYNT